MWDHFCTSRMVAGGGGGWGPGGVGSSDTALLCATRMGSVRRWDCCCGVGGCDRWCELLWVPIYTRPVLTAPRKKDDGVFVVGNPEVFPQFCCFLASAADVALFFHEKGQTFEPSFMDKIFAPNSVRAKTSCNNSGSAGRVGYA